MDPEPHDRLRARRLASEGGAYVAIRDEDRCLAEVAAASDLPLGGALLAVKEIVDLAGHPRRAGSAALADVAPATTDAGIVAALTTRGAVVSGVVAMHELAFGVTGVNRYSGTPDNPLDAANIPGGSSSGSAVAIAEGSAQLAIGTDTGGSVRIPSALCGVVGFKPAYGTYSAEGVGFLAPTLDHVGLHARTVEPLARAHVALTGERPHPPELLRIGIAAEYLAASDPAVADPIREVLEQLRQIGHTFVEVELPGLPAIRETSTTILFAEAATVHRRLLTERAELLGDDVRQRLETGAGIEPEAYRAALADRLAIRAAMSQTLDTVDVVVGPTLPIRALAREDFERDPDLAHALVTFTRLANLTRHPALTLPVPVAVGGVGLQIIGTTNALVLGAAICVETAVGEIATLDSPLA